MLKTQVVKTDLGFEIMKRGYSNPNDSIRRRFARQVLPKYGMIKYSSQCLERFLRIRS